MRDLKRATENENESRENSIYVISGTVGIYVSGVALERCHW